MNNFRSKDTWRYLRWEDDEEIDLPSQEDSGGAELLAADGSTIAGVLKVTVSGDQMPMIDFYPRDGGAFSFFDAIAWRRLPSPT